MDSDPVGSYPDLFFLKSYPFRSNLKGWITATKNQNRFFLNDDKFTNILPFDHISNQTDFFQMESIFFSRAGAGSSPTQTGSNTLIYWVICADTRKVLVRLSHRKFLEETKIITYICNMLKYEITRLAERTEDWYEQMTVRSNVCFWNFTVCPGSSDPN